MSFEQPYKGLRVVDLSQGVAGPYCAMLLARHGADVVKVEPPEGDWSRALGMRYGDNTAFSVAANLGKRSIVVDLKSDAGRAIIDKLVAKADVFLEGFRPGVIDRLGFSYERLKAMNPKLIYLSISGFGQEGPFRDKPAMDPILQAFTGFMSENKGPDGVPHRTPTIIVDMSTGLYAQQAVAAALYARATGSGGRRVNVSLMEAAANLQSIRMMSAVRDGPFRNVAGPGGTYEAADGRWVQIAAVKDHEFQGVCKVLGMEDLLADPRFKTTTDRYGQAPYLMSRAAAAIKSKPAAVWRDALTAAGLQNEVLQTYDEFVKHPHVEATNLITWTQQPGSDQPWASPNPPGPPKLVSGTPAATSPNKGQHTREVLTEIGYGAADIDKLATDKVVMG